MDMTNRLQTLHSLHQKRKRTTDYNEQSVLSIDKPDRQRSNIKLITCHLDLVSKQTRMVCNKKWSRNAYIQHVFLDHSVTTVSNNNTVVQFIPACVQMDSELKHFVPDYRYLRTKEAEFLICSSVDVQKAELFWWVYILENSATTAHTDTDISNVPKFTTSLRIQNPITNVNQSYSGPPHSIHSSPDEIIRTGRCLAVTRRAFQSLTYLDDLRNRTEWVLAISVETCQADTELPDRKNESSRLKSVQLPLRPPQSGTCLKRSLRSMSQDEVKSAKARATSIPEHEPEAKGFTIKSSNTAFSLDVGNNRFAVKTMNVPISSFIQPNPQTKQTGRDMIQTSKNLVFPYEIREIHTSATSSTGNPNFAFEDLSARQNLPSLKAGFSQPGIPMTEIHSIDSNTPLRSPDSNSTKGVTQLSGMPDSKLVPSLNNYIRYQSQQNCIIHIYAEARAESGVGICIVRPGNGKPNEYYTYGPSSIPTSDAPQCQFSNAVKIIKWFSSAIPVGSAVYFLCQTNLSAVGPRCKELKSLIKDLVTRKNVSFHFKEAYHRKESVATSCLLNGDRKTCNSLLESCGLKQSCIDLT